MSVFVTSVLLIFHQCSSTESLTEYLKTMETTRFLYEFMYSPMDEEWLKSIKIFSKVFEKLHAWPA
jgi:hypothetical protein